MMLGEKSLIPVVVTLEVGEINPFRYRDYRNEDETSMII